MPTHEKQRELSAKNMIAVVDYGMGNLRSVQKALEAVGARSRVTRSSGDIRRAQGVVLPGVGAFGEAVKRLKSEQLWNALRDTLRAGKPFLGICLGLQLLFEESEEAPGIKGLGYLKGPVVRFKFKSYRHFKVPHMGWNTLDYECSPIALCLQGIPRNEHFYFVHSYYPSPKDVRCIATTTEYGGRRFCSSISRDRIFASQFHPEKSGAQGLRLLRNFKREVERC